MKIIVNSLDLNDAVAKVSKALPGKDVAPVLECIKFTAENDKLTLYATDKDLAIEKTIDANVEMAVQVNGKLKGTINVPVDSDEAAVLEAVKSVEKVQKATEGMSVVKTILVKNKLINLIVKPAK